MTVNRSSDTSGDTTRDVREQVVTLHAVHADPVAKCLPGLVGHVQIRTTSLHLPILQQPSL